MEKIPITVETGATVHIDDFFMDKMGVSFKTLFNQYLSKESQKELLTMVDAEIEVEIYKKMEIDADVIVHVSDEFLKEECKRRKLKPETINEISFESICDFVGCGYHTDPGKVYAMLQLKIGNRI